MTLKELHKVFLKYPTISTDTRVIQPNSIFFALKGEHFNGNTFAQTALDKGAVYAVVDEAQYATSENIILVEDVLSTLQHLATYHRHQSKARVVALTGSNGKTTTKELIHAVLKKKYRTVATKGNLNNHIGVPLSLLTIEEDTEIAIIEMGANHQKEIEFLTSIAQPDFGYITNFGKAHLEGFGGVEGVIKGKSELYDYLIANDKYIFLNADDPIQQEKLAGYVKKFGYSTTDQRYFRILLKTEHPFVSIEVEGTTINTQLIGAYNFTNCSAAILIGKYFNVPIEAIKDAIEAYVPSNNRSQLLEQNGHSIILDAYNANPTSMAAALENFRRIEQSPKVIFLGDMFELGDTAVEEHQDVADRVAKMQLDEVFLIGKLFSQTDTQFKKMTAFEDLESYLTEHPLPKSTILIKGSRGMALERILDIL
ncbi:MAG: UDP-N-acetylmuramoyl-tripeptide--D-alanyl-D-alanine ligase [Flavobacteriaceae bacterium]